MGWKQCTLPFPGDPKMLDRFETVFMAFKGPKDMALFCRTSEDFKEEIYLLSPGAVERSADRLLGHQWVEPTDQFDQEWVVLVAHVGALQHLGLKPPRVPKA